MEVRLRLTKFLMMILLKCKSATSLACLVLLSFVCSAPAALTVTTANQQGALPLTPTWIPASDSLIAGLPPTSFAGNFSLDASGRNVNSLTAGGSLTINQIPGNNTSTNYVTCGNGGGAGSLVIYTLPASANGYNLTKTTVYGGWKDNGRDAQAYRVFYSTVTNPTSFILLTNIDFNPLVPLNIASATRVILADSAGGLIASNVAAVKFDFASPSSENGYTGYGAITVEGTNAVSPSGSPIAYQPVESPANANAGIVAGTSVTLTAAASGSTPIGYQWRTDGGSGGTLTNIPGATGTNLLVNTTGFATGTYHFSFVATNSFGTNTSPTATITIVAVAMVDIGVSTPTPGPDDISQLLNTTPFDDGFNFYTDNGAAYGNWCGQTFTTGTNQHGYLLQTLSWKSAGNGSGFGNRQLYDLYIYSISANGSAATVIASYQGYGGGTENDWFQWQGLNVPLAPSRVYGYAFGRDASTGGWEHIGTQSGNSYAGGQTMTVANTVGTGMVTYGASGNSDATFDLGITVYQKSAAYATTPTFTNNITPIYAGMSVALTLNEAALGTPPFTYQWLVDNGTGGASMPVGGATGANLQLNTTSLAAGGYNYAVIVNNAYGSSTSAPVRLNILGASAPVILTDIAPAPANEGNVGQTLTYSATFAGTQPLSYQWYVDMGSGPIPISVNSNPSATSNTLVLANVQLTTAGIYFVTAQNSQGSTPSSDSTLVVTPPTGASPRSVTLPPVTLHITPNGPGGVNLTWLQGALLQSTNVNGPWTTIAASLETTNYPVGATNATMFYKVAVASEPRIVNIYNFIRDNDFRLANSEAVLYEATAQQIQLLKQANLPATWALQYDALVDTNYQNLLKTQLGTNDEIAAWWEIPQKLVEKAGLTWRGQHEWDPAANVGFSPGYTPVERRKLVDAYMADFKAIFGYYPRTVGSWFIDEVTLDYMTMQYGIVASCNCKDQVGTDGYTLWGGYWNQAYYPSRLNAYMPAQTKAGQIDVPIFRMLGSDPVYQHGTTPGLFSLEPVYPDAGGSANWVRWFMNNLVLQPSLAFGYTQAGQENSFGWNAMQAGLTRQVALFAAQARAGQIKVETLAESGRWFHDHYSLTPPTSVVYLSDWKKQNRKTVWYDSRFYRLNVLWDNGTFFIRDLHRFDENVVSATHDTALTATSLAFYTLPVMDSALWSGSGAEPVGMWPVLLSSGGITSPMTPQGPPVVKELNATDLSIIQPLSGGGSFSIVCCETNVAFTGLDAQGQPLRWAWNLVGGAQQTSAVQNVASNSITYNYTGVNYQLQLAPGAGSCQLLSNGDIRLSPNSSGKLALILP
ncbi:MAG: hypothetical protein JWR69_1965 [Pedosphaera sp.]|nr:hypothetical protein [Pedosphaera sp.]